MDKLTDADAKFALRKWPIVARSLFGNKPWIRLLPFPVNNVSGLPTMPYLFRMGDTAKTCPDGLYASFGEQYVDVIAIEHCNSEQNLSDKRARYAISKRVNFLALPEEWHSDWLVLVHGGQGGKYRKMRSLIYKHGFKGEQWNGWRLGASRDKKDWMIPIRDTHVIYALKHNSGHRLDSHEIQITHAELNQITQKALRERLKKKYS
ncbi:MAG: hypothetical protein IPH49_10985 [Ignavibacteria bacterium]|nr:hypothetical protein [Ignavibacteria bacterium]